MKKIVLAAVMFALICFNVCTASSRCIDDSTKIGLNVSNVTRHGDWGGVAAGAEADIRLRHYSIAVGLLYSSQGNKQTVDFLF